MLRQLLPNILALITRRDRYLPEIEWSSNSIVHNLFRAWELVAYRPYGKDGVGDTIRRESTILLIQDENGKQTIKRKFFTLEARLLYVEEVVRAMIPKIQFEKVYLPVPVFAGIGGFESRFRPYVFAIARDAYGKNQSTANSDTVSLTFSTSGSNRMLVISTLKQEGGVTLSTSTYNGVSTTNVGNSNYNADPTHNNYTNILYAPATGSNTATSVFSNSNTASKVISCVNYTGVAQSGQPDGSTTNRRTNVSPYTVAVTVTATGCWLYSDALLYNMNIVNVTVGGALATILNSYDDNIAIADSNGTVSTGSVNSTWTNGTQPNFNSQFAMSIAPVAQATFTPKTSWF